MSTKIRSVTIQAFRGYDSRQEFDFTTTAGQPASLVVLYAPNGFGKTSFFDAVEWALTGKIKRFADNEVIKKSAERQGGRILHNYDSPQASGSVEIHFADEQVLIRATKPSKLGSEHWDYNKGTLTDKSSLLPKGKQRAATTVNILTQESGDQAVCFTTPEGRFDALKGFWDTHNDTNIYKSILGVHKFATEKQEELRDEIAKLERLVAEELHESGIGQRMNALIEAHNALALDELDVLDAKLEMPDLDSRHERAILLRNKAAEDTLIQQDKLVKINSLLAGYASHTGQVSYLSALAENHRQVADRLRAVRQLTDYRKELAQLRQQMDAENHALARRYKLKSEMEDFLVIDEDIQQMESHGREVLELLSKEQQLVANLHASTLKLTTRLRKLKSDEGSQEAALVSLTQTTEAYRTYTANRTLYAARHNTARQLVARRRAAYDAQQQAVTAAQDMTGLSRAALEQGDMPAPPSLGPPLLEATLALARVREAELLVQQAEAAAAHTQSLQETWASLLQLGQHFAAETRASACPLCATPFTSYDALRASIAAQLAAGPDTATAARQLLAARQRLDLATQQLAISLEQFNAASQHLVQQLRTSLRERRRRLEAAEALAYHYQALLDTATRQVREVAAATGLAADDLSVDALAQLLATRWAALREAQRYSADLARQVQDKEEQQDKLRGSLRQREDAEKLTRLQIARARSSYLYQRVQAQLDEADPQDRGLAHLDSYIAETESAINSLETAAAAVRAAAARVLPQTETLSETALADELRVLERRQAEVSSDVTAYLELVDSLRLTQELDLPLALHDGQQAAEETMLLLAQQQELLASLIAAAELTRSHLETAKHLQQKRAELARVQSKIARLEDARYQAILYIRSKIAEHFDEELINELYQKIEPHPTLKHIKFVPELDGAKPGLDILASDTLNGHDKAPVVYFSAAQVNILSLSIFLAKALRDKDAVVNPIFLDDPIQFLDSINMLSFIDLVRTIISSRTLDRQLVISTHDENFFKLLQKKIDPVYYDAKFLELTTFGQVKPVVSFRRANESAG